MKLLKLQGEKPVTQEHDTHSEKNFFSFDDDEAGKHKKIYGGKNIQEKAGFITTSSEAEEIEIKRKKERDDDLKLILNASEAFDNLLSDIENKIKEFNASKDRENRLGNAIKSGDLNQLQQMLINEYHRNPDDVMNMNLDQAIDAAEDYIEQEKFTQETLKHEIIQLAKDYDEEYGLTDEQKQQLQELVEKSDIEGVNFDKVLSEIRSDLKSQFVQEGVKQVKEFSLKESENPFEVSITDPFNIAAKHENPDPFNLEQEKSAPDTFSSAPSSSPNPFG